MAVIAQGQRGRVIAGQGGEPAKMVEPFSLAQIPKANSRRPVLIAKAKNAGREVGCRDHIIERSPQLKMTRVGRIGGGNGHEAYDPEEGLLSQKGRLVTSLEGNWSQTAEFSTGSKNF